MRERLPVLRGPFLVLAALAFLYVMHCSPVPERPLSWTSDHEGGASIASANPTFGVELMPSTPTDAIAPVVRIALRFQAAVHPSRAALVTGELTASQRRDVVNGTPSQAVQRRELHIAAWRMDDPAMIVVRPLQVLQRGATYTLTVDDPPTSVPLRVCDSIDPVPLLRRAWPPSDGASATSNVLVYCGDAALGSLYLEQPLEPTGRLGVWSSGIGASFDVPTCIAWAPVSGNDVSAGPSEWPPALLNFQDGSFARLEPEELVTFDSARAPPLEPLACAASEVAIGRACAEVEDDCVLIRPLAADLLWAFEGGLVRASSSAQRFGVHRRPEQAEMLLASMDRFGLLEETKLLLPLKPARPHVVINEVYADPLGPEPAQEWVELVNDGSASVVVADYTLGDSAGGTILPPSELRAGQFVLVVPESFQLYDGLDPPVHPAVTLLRVRGIATQGLANSGEPLTLRDATGQVLSTFPAMAAKSGVSNARVAPDALDDNPSSFGRSPNGSATPGAPNGF